LIFFVRDRIDKRGKLIDQKCPKFVSLSVIGGKYERLTIEVIYNLATKVNIEKVRLHKKNAISNCNLHAYMGAFKLEEGAYKSTRWDLLVKIS
jgi:hypothetical protein